MQTEIKLEITLGEGRVPLSIRWDATDKQGGPAPCEAFLLALWSHSEKSAFRIDLWTNEMPVHEMSLLFTQTFLTMADTYERATGQTDLAHAIRAFGREFGEHSGVAAETGD